MSRNKRGGFGRARFHIVYGPKALFERISFMMRGERDIVVNTTQFQDQGIPPEGIKAVKNFNSADWHLLSAEVREDNGNFVSSSWCKKIGRINYVITIGLNDCVETIYMMAGLNAKLHAKHTGCYVKPREKLYKYVERINCELMRNEPTGDSHETKKGNTDSQRIKNPEAETWRNNPFDDLEKKLPVNVVEIDEWNRTAIEVLQNPMHNWPKIYSKEARIFKLLNTSKDYQYRVASLVNKAESLADVIEELDLLFINGSTLQVSGNWIKAFGDLLAFLLENKRKQLEALDVAGLLRWVRSDKQGGSALSSIEDGSASIEFSSMADLCYKFQWLLIMSGFNLDTVAVRFKSDENFLQKIAEMRRRRLEERAKEQRRTDNYERYRRKLMGQIGRGLKSQRKKTGNSFGGFGNPFVNKTKPKSIPVASGIRFDDGTYIVQDGVVVFVKRHKDNIATDDNGSVLRSNVDHPEEWNGYGVSARETDGRFGGIISEDWVD